MNRYGHDLPKRQEYRPHATPIRQEGANIIVTDWCGRERVFTCPKQATEYAVSLYRTKPKRVVWKEDNRPAHWGRPMQPIVWHSQRGKFSAGRA